MSHLAIETIARLVDDPASTAEAEHLAACETCRNELELMREDVRTLSTLPDMTPAPDAWDALHVRLSQEGLIRAPRRAAFPARTALQAAAAVVLFVGGTFAGRATMSPQRVVVQDPSATATPAPQVRDPIGSAPLAAEPAAAVREPAAQPNPNVTLASSAGPVRAPVPGTIEEAAAQLRQTEELYLSALTRYAELATQTEAGDPIARLAALQSIVMTTQAALNQAPTDPVINGYHLTALAQRDATLRQVAAATNDRWY